MNLIISFGDSSPMFKPCWIHSKNNNFLFYCSAWWNDLWSEPYKSVQNLEPTICRCSAWLLLNWVSFLIRLQVTFDKILGVAFLYTYGRLLLKMKDFARFNFLSFKIYNKGHWSLVNYFFKFEINKMVKTTDCLGYTAPDPPKLFN